METPPSYELPSSESSGFKPATGDERTMAMLCHLLGIFSGFVGALVIWLIKKDESAFVDDQGKEALNFQIALVIAYSVSALLAFVCIGFVFIIGLAVANIVFCIMGALAASRGELYRYPVNLRLIK